MKRRVNLQEPAVATPDRNIHDEEELLIERRAAVLARSPRVRHERVIHKHVAELAALPEVLGRVLARDADVQDLLEPAVEVRVHVVAGPLEAEGVEALGEVGAADLAAGGGAPEGVGVGRGAWGWLVGLGVG